MRLATRPVSVGISRQTVFHFAGITLGIVVAILLTIIQPSEAKRLQPSTSNEAVDFQKSEVQNSYGKIPLSFELNKGQTDQQVKYFAH